MKRIALASAATCALLAYMPSANAAGWYVKGFGGGNWIDGQSTSTTLTSLPTTSVALTLTTDADTGFVLGAAVGRDFAGGWSMELEYSYRKNDIDSLLSISGFTGGGPVAGSTSLSGDVTANALMANVAYEFQMQSKVKPFVMGGIGWADVEADVGTLLGFPLSYDDSNFAWQLGGGLNLALSPTTSASLEYRYFDGGSVEGYDYQAQSVMAGLKVKF